MNCGITYDTADPSSMQDAEVPPFYKKINELFCSIWLFFRIYCSNHSKLCLHNAYDS